MATYKAVSNGNSSDLAIWQDNTTGSFVASSVLPGVNDDVYPNGFIVQLNTNTSVKSLRVGAITGVLSGGRFEVSTNVNITTVDGIFGSTSPGVNFSILNSCVIITGVCTTLITSNIIGGYTYQNGLSISAPANVTIVGNQSSSSAAGYGNGVWNTSSGTITIIGDQIGNYPTTQAFRNTGVGAVIYITGNQICTIAISAFSNEAAATININGNQIGGSFVGSHGFVNSAGGFNIIGNQVANSGYGVHNTSAGAVLNISGTAFASSSYAAIYNSTTSTIIFSGKAFNNLAVLAIFSPRIFYKIDSNSEWQFNDFDGNTKGLYGAGAVIGQPPPSDVRYNTIYGANNDLVGTCHVPPKASVVSGVPTDDGVGTWAFTNELITRLQNCATVESVGEQLEALM